jgi:hypothetical protein
MNHNAAWDLIPWFVNGRASDSERSDIELHLQQCAECRAEIEAQRALMNAMQTTPVVESMPRVSLQKLWSRIEADPLTQTGAPMKHARNTRLVGWLAAAVAAEALLVGTLASALYQSRPDSAGNSREFRTVSSTQTAGGTPGVRAVFSPELTLGELQVLLGRSKLTIIRGPSEDGVYTLALASSTDDARQALLTLRAHPASRFAEPIGP